MSHLNAAPRSIKTIRWVARIWSVPIFLFAIFRLVIPDPYVTEPVPALDWFLLSLLGVSILGLLVAWRWELIGGIITITSMFARELFWVTLKGPWMVSFLIFWLLIATPAVLFLIAWGLERKAKQL